MDPVKKESPSLLREPRPQTPLPAHPWLWSLGLIALLTLGGALPASGEDLLFTAAYFDGVGGFDDLDGASAVAAGELGYLFAVSEADDALMVFTRDLRSGALTVADVLRDGVDGVSGLDGPEHLAVWGNCVYVVSPLAGTLAVFQLNTSTDELSFLEVFVDGNPPGPSKLAGATWVEVQDISVYVASRFDDSVSVFERTPSFSCLLTRVEDHTDGILGVDGLDGVTSVVVSSDGDHVYAAGVRDQAVAIFSREALHGALTFIGTVPDALPDAEIDADDFHALALSKGSDTSLYVVNHLESWADGWISTFSRNASTGALTQVPPVLLASAVDDCSIGIEGDSFMTLPSNAKRAFVTHPYNSSLVHFERNTLTGELTLLASICDESIGMGANPRAPDGLFAGRGVTTNGTGTGDPSRFIYVASGLLEDALAVYTWPLFADGFESGNTTDWAAQVP